MHVHVVRGCLFNYMRIFILLGHPDKEASLSNVIASTYEVEAKRAGHDVRRLNIGDLVFDSNLHKGYRAIQTLEPDLVKVQENLTWCEHFVLVYPNWWGGMPAVLKGMWDRMFLPRFAFRMHKNRLAWDRLLTKRTARVIILCGNPPIFDHLAFGNLTASIRSSLLDFAGFKTRVTELGPSETASEAKRKRWKRKTAAFARAGR